MLRRLCVVLTVALIPVLVAGAAPSVQLARKGTGLLPVMVGAKAGKQTRAAAEELAVRLGRISGGRLGVETGDGAKGIVVGVPGDFAKLPFEIAFKADPFGREEYVMRSGEGGLWLLGATELGAQHAVWDLLYRLGYRQFFPGPVWEVVPSSPDLAITVDVREKPDYYARRIWYNWGLWGYNRVPYANWCARNRMARGFMLNSGHAYGAIMSANREAFKEHPEYRALVGGKRSGGKFCISNPGLRKLVADYAVAQFKKHPDLDSISMEPSDGGGHCECEACAKLGSISDRALILANEAAQAVNALGLGPKYIGMYACNQHCAPPSIRVDPHVIVSCTTGFLTGGWTFDRVVRGWQKQGATIGVYDYFSVIVWDWNRPRAARAAHPAGVASAIKQRYEMGARFYDCESGDAWGPYGLGYYVASRVMWDVDQAAHVDAIVDDFLTRAFGPAREPMKAFYDLITVDTTRRSSADLIGRMYRHLTKAREAAAGDEAVRRRIDDLILYTRYAELYDQFASATGKAKGQAKTAVLTYGYRIRKTMMIHAYGLWARMATQRAALDPKNPLKDETPVSEQELLGFLKNGIANNQPADIDFKPVTFSQDLVPAAGKLDVPDVPAGNYTSVPQSRQLFHIWIDKAPANLAVQVKTKKVLEDARAEDRAVPRRGREADEGRRERVVGAGQPVAPGDVEGCGGGAARGRAAGRRRLQPRALAGGIAGDARVGAGLVDDEQLLPRRVDDVFLRAEGDEDRRRLGRTRGELGAADQRNAEGRVGHGAPGLRQAARRVVPRGRAGGAGREVLAVREQPGPAPHGDGAAMVRGEAESDAAAAGGGGGEVRG